MDRAGPETGRVPGVLPSITTPTVIYHFSSTSYTTPSKYWSHCLPTLTVTNTTTGTPFRKNEVTVELPICKERYTSKIRCPSDHWLHGTREYTGSAYVTYEPASRTAPTSRSDTVESGIPDSPSKMNCNCVFCKEKTFMHGKRAWLPR